MHALICSKNLKKGAQDIHQNGKGIETAVFTLVFSAFF